VAGNGQAAAGVRGGAGRRRRREQGTLQRYGEECIERCRDGEHAGFLDDLAAIADLHVQGYALALDKLFAKGRFQKLSLPTYPFARERYWVPQAAARPAPAQGAAGTVLHPLVQRNTSDFDEQRFSTTLTGQEFFLTDHMVQGRKILPGVACLEMAYVALREAGRVETMGAIRLERVTWHRPLAVEERPEVIHIGLRPLDGEEIAYEIYSRASESETVLYAEGTGIVGEPVAAPRVDIEALRAECTDSRSGEDAYRKFEQRGIRYGSRFRGLRSLDTGKGLVVAELELAGEVPGQYVLHPSVVDSALQAAVALVDADADGLTRTYVPYALESVQVFGPCASSMWAVVRGGAGSHGNSYKFDIDVCAEDGTVRARMRGLRCRELGGDSRPAPNRAAGAAGDDAAQPGGAAATTLLATVWDPVTVADGAAWPAAQERVLVVGGSAPQQEALLARLPSARVLELPATASLEAIQAALQAHDGIDHLFWIAPDEAPGLEDDGLIEAQQRGVLACLRVVKALLALAYGARPLGWTIVTAGTQAVLRHEQCGRRTPACTAWWARWPRNTRAGKCACWTCRPMAHGRWRRCCACRPRPTAMRWPSARGNGIASSCWPAKWPLRASRVPAGRRVRGDRRGRRDRRSLDGIHDAQLWRAGGVDRPPRTRRHDRSAAVEVDG
jgi:polyketide synthase PksM